MTENEPDFQPRSRWSPLWLLPLAALVGGLWMVVQTYLSAGPTITIDFESANGIEAGKTKVRMLNVEVGLVEAVSLREDAAGVTATVALDASTAKLLREDTQFWVVRARVGAAGISGIGTLLSGGYIELAPGEGALGKRRYVGLESPPLTPLGAPGMRIRLVSQRAAVGVGDSVFYQGFKAGRVESVSYDADRELAVYEIFVDAPYDRTIVSSTRFWDASGLTLDAAADGIQLRVDSVESLLLGGIAFTTPSELPVGSPVAKGAEFTLYPSYSEILKSPYRYGVHYVVKFDQALGGLLPGAPLTFVVSASARVERILLDEFTSAGVYNADQPLPVLIYLEPGRLEVPDTIESVEEMQDALSYSVARGLRATLQVGNLLTGSQQISLDFFPAEPAVDVGRFGDYAVIPSIESGVVRLEHQVSDLLSTLNRLPLKDTIGGANRALTKAETLLADLDEGAVALKQLLKADSTQRITGDLVGAVQELNTVLNGFSPDSALYQDLRSALASLDQSLANLNNFSATLARKPNALVFSAPQAPDPQPKAPR